MQALVGCRLASACRPSFGQAVRRAPAPPRCQAEPAHRQDALGLTLPGLCSSTGIGCSLEDVAAAVRVPISPAQQQQLAHRLAERAAAPKVQALAAALAAQQQQQQAPQGEDAVWTLGSGARHGDPWCLLQLAAHCAGAAAFGAPQLRRHSYVQALRLVQQAAAAVQDAAADCDVWLRGGSCAALGSFAALCTSGASPTDVAAQLAEVSRLVTDAAAEEGDLELWALQDLLTRQEQRLALARAAGS